MLRDDFEYIWEQCVDSSAADILSYYPSEEGKRWEWKYDSSDEVRNDVFTSYCSYNSQLHEKFFQGERIDIHKIASCLCAALIDTAPMTCSYLKGIPRPIAMSNYLLAFHTSMALVFMNLLDEYEQKNPGLAAKLERKGRFSFPRVTPGHDLYTMGKVKCLALNHHYDKPFDILGYADTLYWIEFYNRHIIESGS